MRVPDWVAKTFAPITVRFFETEDLLATLDFLMNGRELKDVRLKNSCKRNELIIAKELIRRKVVFWTDLCNNPYLD